MDLCRWLGIDEDREVRYSMPVEGQVCYAQDPPATITEQHQKQFCLTESHAVCRFYRDPPPPPPPPLFSYRSMEARRGPATTRPSRLRVVLWGALTLVGASLILCLAWVVLALRPLHPAATAAPSRVVAESPLSTLSTEPSKAPLPGLPLILLRASSTASTAASSLIASPAPPTTMPTLGTSGTPLPAPTTHPATSTPLQPTATPTATNPPTVTNSPMPTNSPTATTTPSLRPTGTATVTPTPVSRAIAGQILFRSNRGGQTGLWAMQADGTVAFPLSETDAYEAAQSSEALSPDGDEVVYIGVVDSLPAILLRQVKSQNGWPLVVFDRGRLSSPVWSPDGTWIGFEAAADDSPQIWLVNRSGRGVRRLTSPNSGNASHPTFSPDGARLAFVRLGSDGRRQIWTIGTDGQAETNISNNAHDDWDPVWLK